MKSAKIEAYIDQLESGNFNSNIFRVMKFIKQNPNTDIYLMEQRLGMLMRTLTPVIDKLMDNGVVDIVGQRVINRSTCSIFVFIEDKYKREKLAQNRKCEKLVAWAKRGMKDFSDCINIFTQQELGSLVNQNTPGSTP